MRAFLVMRKLLQAPPESNIAVIRRNLELLQKQMDELFADQNDINEDTRMQLELIHEAIAELQSKKSSVHSRNPLGYVAIQQAREKER